MAVKQISQIMRNITRALVVLLVLVVTGSHIASAQIAAKDASFTIDGSGFNNAIYAAAQLSNGKYVVGGSFTTLNGQSHVRIAGLNSDGTHDDTFLSGTGFNSTIYDILPLPDGKIIVVGNFTSYNGNTGINRIVRLNADGSVDFSFVSGSGFNGDVFEAILQADGSIVAVGSFTAYNNTTKNRVARILANGTIDNTFSIGTGFSSTAYAIKRQSDGKYLVGGQFTTFNTFPALRLARLNADGSFDSSFSTGDGLDGNVLSIALQSDGGIVIGGGFQNVDGNSLPRIARLASSGAVDPTFNVGTGFSNTVEDIAIDNTGNILTTGTFTTYNTIESRSRICRILPSGDIDYLFNVGSGLNVGAERLFIQPDERIVVVGSFTTYNSQSSSRIVRLLNHSILSESLLPTGTYCAGQSGVVSYSVTGTYNTGNIFKAQLSDATGNFSSPVEIGSVTAVIPSSIPFVIPSGTNSGGAYRIRVVSTDPPVVGTDLGGTSGIAIAAIPSPTVVVSSSDGTTICAGEEVTFSSVVTDGGASPTYEWFSGDDPIPSANQSTYVTTQLVDGEQIRVSVVSNASCADGEAVVSNTITMTVQPIEAPLVSIESNSGTSICAGQSVTFTATATNAGATPAYQWKRNDGNVGLGGSTYTTATLSDGDVITCEVFSNATCPQPASVLSDPITITVNPNVTPAVTITASPGESVCSGTEVVFTAVLENEGTTPILEWFLNDVAVGTNSPTYTESALADGDEVVVKLTSNAACVDPVDAESNTIQMTVTPIISINLSVIPNPAGPICEGTEVTFTADVHDDIDDEVYAWTVNGLPVGQDDDVFTSSSLVDGDVVEVTATTDEVCVVSDSETSTPIVMQVATSNEPELTILSDIGTDICTGSLVTFTATVVGGGSAPSFAWTVNGNAVGTDSPTFSSATLAEADVVACTYTATDPCAGGQQSVSDNVVMHVLSVPVISGSITGSGSVCADEALTYAIAIVIGADAYTWSLPVDWTGSSTTNSISTVSAAAGGTIAVTADNQCGSSTPVTLNVVSSPNFATVSGVVTIDGAPVFNGWVFAFKQELDTLGYIKADSTVILGGNYSFDELPLYGVPFILMAVATESASNHTIAAGTLPTYYAKNTANGQDTVYHQWDRPGFNCAITAACGTVLIKNFKILLEGNANGDCALNGSVRYWCAPNCKTATDDPIPGVDVVVERVPPGNAFSWGQTDLEGRFRFENVPVDDAYRIYVNIPGIPMTDTYSIEVTPSDTAISNLDFVVDTVANTIFIVEPNGIAHTAALEKGLTVMPNPMQESMTVVLKRGMDDAVGFRILNLSGQSVRSQHFAPVRRFTVERDGLSTGIYFLETHTTNGDRTMVKIAIQ